ncbi:MAG: peptidylprolyl isomerase [Burkholderiales bacterium]|nr:peptidylprolyl isomerase [Burkholderiales bacterium]
MNLLKIIFPLLLAGIGSMSAVAAQAQGVKVNGVTIPQARLDFLVKNATLQGQPDTPELRIKVKEELVAREVLAQEAAKKGLEKNPEVITQIELQRQGVLINAYLQDYAKAQPITDEMMKKEYDQVKAQNGNKEYKARHILVETEDEAKQIIGQIKKGGNFEKIAADKSKDTGSKAQGGNLDWSPANRYVPPFAQALGKLKKGQMTDAPVQTQFGWHVIRLDEERSAKFPTFEEAKVQIQQQMQQQAVTKLIADLRAKAKVE